MAVIPYRQIPLMMAKGNKEVKAAAANTLNSLAYDVRDAITEELIAHLDFRGSSKAAIGMKVERPGARPSHLEQAVWTDRGWLEYHLIDAQHSASAGTRYPKGKYLFIPANKREMTTRPGRSGSKLKAKYQRMVDNSFTVKGRGNARLVMYRPRRGKDRSPLYLGVLVRAADYTRSVDGEELVRNIMSRNAVRLFNGYLSGRYRGRRFS